MEENQDLEISNLFDEDNPDGVKVYKVLLASSFLFLLINIFDKYLCFAERIGIH